MILHSCACILNFKALNFILVCFFLGMMRVAEQGETSLPVGPAVSVMAVKDQQRGRVARRHSVVLSGCSVTELSWGCCTQVISWRIAIGLDRNLLRLQCSAQGNYISK